MRNFAFQTVLLALAMGLTACGGGDNAFVGTGTTGTTGTTAAAASVGVTASTATIPSDGSAPSVITALVRDANNNAISGATVTFSSSAGSLAITSATTDASGDATASLAAGGAAAGTAITVTAKVGSVSGTTKVTVSNTKETLTVVTNEPQIPSDGSKGATITALLRDANNNFVTGATVTFTSTSGGLTVVSGTTDANGSATATLSAAGDPTNREITVTATSGPATASVPVDVVGTKLTIAGVASLVQGSQGTYTVALTDSSGTGIAAKTVAITSSISGNAVTPASVTTDSTGHATFNLTATSSGADTLTATGLGLTAEQAVSISNQRFVFSAPAADAQIVLNAVATVTVNWTASGVPQVGKSVTFAATRGTLSTTSAVTTDGSGNATVTISSTTAGPAVISATGTGVTGSVNVDFLATVPNSVTLQASPATIAPQGQSTITAIVRDANNNLVEGKTVAFTLVNDVTGGSLSVASAQTDDQGKAQTVYTASTTTSAKNGVVVNALVQGTSVTGSTDLTVGGQTVFLSLGTGNTIIALNSTQYELPYAVQAIDSAGNSLDGVNVTLAVTSVSYVKGSMVWNGTIWAADDSVTSGPDPCPSEDLNNNGILDAGEDFNNNGKLDPGLVASVTPSSLITANGGTGLLNLIYPKDHAYWVTVTLTATAIVQGTQASTSATLLLPGLSTDYDNETVQPPGATSPYGIGTTCANPN